LRPRLAFKFALSLGGLLLVIAAAGSVLSFYEARDAERLALERQGDAISMSLSYAFEVLLDQGELASIQRIAVNSLLLPNVREVIAVDLDAKVIASGERADIDKETRSTQLREFIQGGVDRTVTLEPGDHQIILLRPLRRGQFVSALDSGDLGAVQITMDARESEAMAFAVARRQLFVYLGTFALLAALTALVLNLLVVRPLYRLADAARHIRRGDRSRRARIPSRDEIGLVARVFDEMADEVERTVSSLEEQVKARTADLEREVAARSDALSELRLAHEALGGMHNELRRGHDELVLAHAELKVSTEERVRLLGTVKEIGAPVIRAHRDVVIVPIVGSVDAERARHIEEAMLAGVARHRARVVLLDLTGVPSVDSPAVAALLRATRSAALLGARVILVGMSPSLAVSIVDIERDLTGLVAHRNLEEAYFHVLRSLGFAIKRRPSPG
jgi:anti-anti-sigma factor